MPREVPKGISFTQMTANKTMRTRLLLLAATLLAVVSVFVGFYALRNIIADRFEFIYFARGTQLAKPDAGKLERDLKSDPGSLADRIELLAFYSFKIYKDGLTPEELANRREYTFWIIRHHPTSTFASNYAAAFDGDDRDPEGLQ